MHFGHTYNNYGPLDYLDVGYKSNGLSVGKKDPQIIGYGTLQDAPVASAGLCWLDESGTVWISDGESWDILSIDSGEYTVLVDSDGRILITDDFSILVEE